MSKIIRQSVVLGVVAISVFSGVTATTETITHSVSNLLKETSAPRPYYPKSLWNDSPDGYVTLQFDVSKRGLVENPCIVASTVPGKFELYALHALKAHRYEYLKGPAQEVHGVSKRIEFTLDSGPIDPVKPNYPKAALESGTEGYVVVEFGVTEWGSVRHLVVAGAEPAEFFEASALDAANLFKFAPDRFTEEDRILHKFTFSLDSKPLNPVIARYPVDAKEKGIQGHVIVEFDINDSGKVENTNAIFASANELEAAAVEAVAQFTYDLNRAAQGVLHKIEFKLDQNYRPLTKEQPEYPRQALLDGVEGYVILEFDINEQGSVENPLVIEAKPKDVFDESAIAAAMNFKYEPRYVDGKPTRVENVINRIHYVIANEKGGSRRSATPVDPVQYERQRPTRRLVLKPTHRLFFDGTLTNGSVLVEFDVNKEGYVEDPKIVEIFDSDISDELEQRILDEVNYFRYSPLEIDKTRMSIDGVRHRINLRFRKN